MPKAVTHAQTRASYSEDFPCCDRRNGFVVIWNSVCSCLRAPRYGLTPRCALGFLVGSATQVPQLQLLYGSTNLRVATPLSERYGLTLTAFAAWRVVISDTWVSGWDELVNSSQSQKSKSNVTKPNHSPASDQRYVMVCHSLKRTYVGTMPVWEFSLITCPLVQLSWNFLPDLDLNPDRRESSARHASRHSGLLIVVLAHWATGTSIIWRTWSDTSFCLVRFMHFISNTRKRGRIANWGRPTPRQSFSALITTTCQVWSR